MRESKVSWYLILEKTLSNNLHYKKSWCADESKQAEQGGPWLYWSSDVAIDFIIGYV